MPTPAEINARLRAMNQAAQELSDLIELRVSEFNSEAVRLESELYDLTNQQALRLSTSPDGTIKNTAANIASVSRIDLAFKALSQRIGALMKRFSEWLFEVTQGVVGVYEAGKFTVANVQALTTKIEAVIGITNGVLTPGGYLYRLSSFSPVRQRLKDFMLSGIAGKTSLAGLSKGLRGLVQGQTGTSGIMSSYLNQYAYDTFNQVREIVNQDQAERLKLNHLMYQGSLIAESRSFCIKRAGKVFTITETKTWKDDADLIDKKTKDSYNPLIERGRYNCRHWILYISKQMYDNLKAIKDAS